jgi:isopenicillin-N epimerase
LCETLQIDKPAPDDMLGTMAAVPLPDGESEALQDRLFFEHHIEVPVVAWPQAPKRVLRVSAAVYNVFDEYERLATALRACGVTSDE